VGPHHSEGLLDAQLQRPAHPLGDMATKGTQAAGQGAAGLCLALLDGAAGLEGRIAQLPQLLLGGVVGILQRLGPLSRVPQGGAQAWNRQNKGEIRKGNASPLTEKPIRQESNSGSPSTCFLSISRARRSASTASSRRLTASLCSWRAISWFALAMLSTMSSPSVLES
jgi:hypothetical protein